MMAKSPLLQSRTVAFRVSQPEWERLAKIAEGGHTTVGSYAKQLVLRAIQKT